MTYQIKDSRFKHETFTIDSIENIDHLPHSKDALINSGKEGVVYHMKRVIEGTRKKSYTLLCYRFVNSNSFITVI